MLLVNLSRIAFAKVRRLYCYKPEQPQRPQQKNKQTTMYEAMSMAIFQSDVWNSLSNNSISATSTNIKQMESIKTVVR